MKKSPVKKVHQSPKKLEQHIGNMFLSDRMLATKSIKDIRGMDGNVSDRNISKSRVFSIDLPVPKSAQLRKEAADVRAFKSHHLLPDSDEGRQIKTSFKESLRPPPMQVDIPRSYQPSDSRYISSLLADGRSKVYLLAADSAAVRGVFEGGFVDGLPQGAGKAVYEDNSVYEGEWSRGEYHGAGKLVTSTFHYTGSFKDSLFDGQGKLVLVNVGEYDGLFLRGKFCGYGLFKWLSGKLYRGHWRDNQMHLKGYLMWPDGRKYIGNFNHGKKDGKGYFYFSGGMMIEAKWKNGKVQKILQKNTSVQINDILTR